MKYEDYKARKDKLREMIEAKRIAEEKLPKATAHKHIAKLMKTIRRGERASEKLKAGVI